MKIIFSTLLITIVLVVSSCNKVEGPGGSATIQGKIYVEVKDGAGNIINEYYGPKEDVYIIYGGGIENFYDDKTETNGDGLFEFRYLEPGTYTLFSYSYCPTCPSGKELVHTTVEIKKKGDLVVLDSLVIRGKP